MARFSFPARERLKRRKDFLRIYRQGTIVHTRFFVLYIAANQQDHHRFGTTVSRRVGNAVVRNRVKRLLREVYRRHRRSIPGNWDLVVNARVRAAGATLQELDQVFEKAVGSGLQRNRS